MLTHEPTAAMLREWKECWKLHSPRLHPNRKTGAELLQYVRERYSLTEMTGPEAAAMLEALRLNVLENPSLAEKLPPGTFPQPRAFRVENAGKGIRLYKKQEPVFRGIYPILLGIDMASGCYQVEGSALLWDELCAFQGLDKMDIQNPYCDWQYIDCLRRFPQKNG